MDETGAFRQKRRSFPLESVFFRAFPDMYSSLLDYIKSRLMSDGSEVRMGLVFKPFTKKKQNKTEMRIQNMT